MKISVSMPSALSLTTAMPEPITLQAQMPTFASITVQVLLPTVIDVANPWQWADGTNILWNNGYFMETI